MMGRYSLKAMHSPAHRSFTTKNTYQKSSHKPLRRPQPSPKSLRRRRAAAPPGRWWAMHEIPHHWEPGGVDLMIEDPSITRPPRSTPVPRALQWYRKTNNNPNIPSPLPSPRPVSNMKEPLHPMQIQTPPRTVWIILPAATKIQSMKTRISAQMCLKMHFHDEYQCNQCQW